MTGLRPSFRPLPSKRPDGSEKPPSWLLKIAQIALKFLVKKERRR